MNLIVLEMGFRWIVHSSIGIHVPDFYRDWHIRPSILRRSLSKLRVNRRLPLSRRCARPLVALSSLALRAGIHQVQPFERQVRAEVRPLRTGSRIPGSEVLYRTGLHPLGNWAFAEGAEAAELHFQPFPQQAIVSLGLRILAVS